MNLNSKLVIATILLATALIMGLSIALRRGRGYAAKPVVKALPGPAKAARVPKVPVFVPARKAPEEQVARSMEDARIRSTYQNFRSAVAVGNAPLQNALRDVLKKDGEFALKVAREDLDRSTDPSDREIARRALDALGQ